MKEDVTLLHWVTSSFIWHRGRQIKLWLHAHTILDNMANSSLVVFFSWDLLTIYSVKIQNHLHLRSCPGLPVLDILANDEEVRLDETLDDLTVTLLT